MKPTVIEGGARLRDGDAVIFFNFRADRARELTNALTSAKPEAFAGKLERRPVVKPAVFVCFTEYDETFGLPVAFHSETPRDILGERIAGAGLTQLRIAETEKYAHVTYFFNGGIETPFPGEDRVLIPSPRDVATYDHKPEMSAIAVTDELLRRLAERGLRLHPAQLREPRHGGTHGRDGGGDQGGRDRRPRRSSGSARRCWRAAGRC